jgi:hypothetical protein
MQVSRRWIGWVAVFGVGVLAGTGLAQLRAAPVVVAEPEACKDAAERLGSIESALSTRSSDASRAHEPAELARRLERLSGQMAHLIATPLCRADEGHTRDQARAEDPRNPGAFREARERVEYAIADGRWTEQDASSLRELLPLLTAKQQDEVLGALMPALNQDLEVEFFPPF